MTAPINKKQPETKSEENVIKRVITALPKGFFQSVVNTLNDNKVLFGLFIVASPVFAAGGAFYLGVSPYSTGLIGVIFATLATTAIAIVVLFKACFQGVASGAKAIVNK